MDNEDRDPDDEDPVGELEGFRGLYLRRLADHQLLGRIPYSGAVDTGTRIGANDRLIAIEQTGRVDVVERATGVVRHIAGAAVALDPYRMRVAHFVDGAVEVLAID
jgi:hypothetical protein